DREAERDQQDVLVTPVAEAADHQAIEEEAEDEGPADHQRQRDVGVDAQQPPQEEDGIHGQHQQAAMGEVDDVQDAVDQGETYGDQHIDAAGEQPVQDAGEDDLGIEQTVR